MKPVTAQGFNSLQFKPLIPQPLHLPNHFHFHLHLHFIPSITTFPFSQKPSPNPPSVKTLKSQKTPNPHPKTATHQDDGIPIDDVKTLAKFKSRHNYIRVLEVSRKADHPFAGSRLLLLDGPGNIHSIYFLFKTLTHTYFDVLATLPPILPPGPLGILGFGAGSSAKLLLELYPTGVVHGWELDPAVILVGREYFGLSRLERDYPDRLFVYIGNALHAGVKGGFAGLLVDLFSKGRLIPELQDPRTWERLKKGLREGGRIMVNAGGDCVESEDMGRDGRLVMEDTLKAMSKVFGKEEVRVLRLGNVKEDSSIALTGKMPDVEEWKKGLPKSLRVYAHMWQPFTG
ncbi:hypothetical protein LguiB_022741 [Lonicera macranthoides]